MTQPNNPAANATATYFDYQPSGGLVVVYSTPTCPRCTQLKQHLSSRGIEYLEMVVGKDVSREKFIEQFPTVRSFPHLVELPR